MFDQIQLEQWYAIFRNIGMVLFFATFGLMLLRVFFLTPAKKIAHDSALPFENENVKDTHANGK